MAGPREAPVAADTEAIRDIGLATWLEGFFWPVSDIEFVMLLGHVWEAFADMLAATEDEARDALLADTGMVAVIAQHLHARLVAARCGTERPLIIGRFAKPCYEPIWNQMARIHPEPRTALQRLHGTAGDLARAAVFNRPATIARRLDRVVRGADAWAIGSNSLLRQAYLRQQGWLCRFVQPAALLDCSSDGVDGGSLGETLPRAVSQFLDRVADSACERGALLEHRDTIERVWLGRLRALGAMHRQIGRRRDLPPVVLLTNAGQVLNRIVALAARRHGSRVVGFSHGNEGGAISQRHAAAGQFAPCDTFVCPSPASAQLYEDGFNRSPVSRVLAVSFASVRAPYYAAVRAKAAAHPLLERVRRVLVMGNPLIPLRYAGPRGGFFAFQLDAALRLIRLLKAHGFDPVYKAHPEVLEPGRMVFPEFEAPVDTRVFETMWHTADAFIFAHPATTAFGFAVCTNRPILVLDIEGTAWNREPYEHLRRRCAMIPTRVDDRNRLMFDEARIVAALRRRPAAPDPAYVRTFLGG